MDLQTLQKEFEFAAFVPLDYKIYVLTANYDLVIDNEQNRFTILDRRFDRSYTEVNVDGIKIENIKSALKDMNLN